MSELNIKRTVTIPESGITKIKEYLLFLGFNIKKSERNPRFVSITIPENYSMVLEASDNDHMLYNIFDANDMKRGFVWINKNNLNGSNVTLLKKLNIHSKKTGHIRHYYFGTESEMLFSVDGVNEEIFSVMYNANLASKKMDELKEQANVLYPEWENPLAYWDKSMEELREMVSSDEVSKNNSQKLTRKIEGSN